MKYSFTQKIRYRFDNFMTRGTAVLIVGLFVAITLIVLFVTSLVTLFSIQAPDSGDISFIELFWQGFLRTLDPGTMGDDSGWGFRLMMLLVTLAGIIIFSTLIGVINSGLAQQLENLRKGKSLVVEKNHTIILGWSNKVFTIICELIEANANQPDGCVVVLADKDKIAMEDAIRHHISCTGNTRVVCRSGKPVLMNDLKIVNPDASKAIIVLAQNHPNSDAEVIKTVLAVTNNPKRHAGKYHIVAEINDANNASVCKMVGKDEVEVVLSSDIISKITAQTCRQSGLSMVYMGLLVYEGDELYFQEQPELVGKTYREALMAYETSSLIGLLKNDASVLINPDMDTIIEKNDQVLCISEDDDTVIVNGNPSPVDEALFSEMDEDMLTPEKTLVLGWNKRGQSIIKELDAYVKYGSTIDIVANIQGIQNRATIELSNLQNCSFNVYENDTTRSEVLESLALESYQNIIILSYSGIMQADDCDSATLITLLHLRDIADRRKLDLPVVSEMLIDENRMLAEVTKADDFIVSEKVISLLLAQISEQKKLSDVFTDIFQPDGSEIYLKPVQQYVKTGIEVDFYTVLASAIRHGHTAIGYRTMQHKYDLLKNYGIVINPKKSQKIRFSPDDKIIVLALD